MAKSKKNGSEPNAVKYETSSHLPCPDCLKMIHVGTAGPANLLNHKPACKGRPKGRTQKISDFFAPKPRAPLVPSTAASAPALIPSTSTASREENHASFASSPLHESSPGADLALVGSGDSSFLDYGVSDASQEGPGDTEIFVHGRAMGHVPISPGLRAVSLDLKLEPMP
ncbi:hypothetical protein B0H12DRAFT_1107814 [Mycena haematopus]|nr:hypothetical protein B0H12DRAFT_1107814 [Mycena haematopus]